MQARLKRFGDVAGKINREGFESLLQLYFYPPDYAYALIKWIGIDVEPQKISELTERIVAYIPEAKAR